MAKGEKDQETNNDEEEEWDGVEDEKSDGEVVGKKKVSEDLQFDQIKLLDDVIKEKIFGYLDL